MKFLRGITSKESHLMLLNIMYFDDHDYKKSDVLTIIFKDIDTGKKYVENITDPEIDIWIVKPEFRDRVAGISRDWYPKEWMMKVRVPYRGRYRKIQSILKLDNPELAKASPYVAYSNMDIRTYYAIQFQLEYGNDLDKPLNIGFYDIESDIIELDKGQFPEPGQCPINIVTYVDEPSLTAYTFILRTAAPSFCKDPETGLPYDNREQIKYLEDHQTEFIDELHRDLDPTYGKMEYNLIFFDSEAKLISALFKVMEACSCDFAEAWNEAYDLANLTKRPFYIMQRPEDLICSDDFMIKQAQFIEDKNPIVHKRKHTINISHPTVFTDAMLNYAGIRSGKGKIPSLKLNAIAQKVLGDSKLDYSEEGNIRLFPYKNFWKFAKYNIRDVMLLLGIHRVTEDITDIYSRMSDNALMSNEVFTSTAMLTNSVTIELNKLGYIVGNNRNKYSQAVKDALSAKALEDAGEDPDELQDANDPDSVDPDESEDSEEEEQETEIKKRGTKKAFEGALVGNPNRMLPSGVIVNGVLMKKIHDHDIDFDVTALYPTIMRIVNLSNETMIGRVEFVDDVLDYFKYIGKADLYPIVDGKLKVDVKGQVEYDFNRLPMYDYTMIDDDEGRYHLNMSDIVVNEISEGAIEDIATQFFRLPSFDELDIEYRIRLAKKLQGVS